MGYRQDDDSTSHATSPDLVPDTSRSNPWPDSGRWSASNAQASLAQLQTILDNLASQSMPLMREIGAKAAEIAAIAAERTGPLAVRAADATAQAAGRVAERSRTIATELRRPAAPHRDEPRAGGVPRVEG